MTQDEMLANDILERNWYPALRNETKYIELVVHPSNYHVGCNCAPVCKFDPEVETCHPRDSFNAIMDWRKRNRFLTEVIIDGIWDMEELIYYVLHSLPNDKLHIPLPLTAYLDNKTNKIWKDSHVSYYFSAKLGDKINWEEVDVPMILYFSDGARAKILMDSLELYQLRYIYWYYQPTEIVTEHDVDVLYDFYTSYYKRIKGYLHSDEYLIWIMREAPFKIEYNQVFTNEDKLPCLCQDRLTINLQNMCVYFCPGLVNREFNMGKLDLHDPRGFKPNNTPLMIFKDHIRQGVCIGCDNCPSKGLCHLPCLARGYDETMILGSVGRSVDTHVNLDKLNKLLLNYHQNDGTLSKVMDVITDDRVKHYINWLLESVNGS